MAEENNSQRLKQRVVGAVVLVSLAVIFVPMLLDGDGTGPGADGPTIPPRPGYRFETLEIPLELPAAPTAAAEPIPVEPAVPPAPKPVAAPTPPPKPKPVPTAKPPAAAPAPKGDWVVQVGSFSQQANADGLRDRLKAAGYPAYSEAVTADGKPIYRVRIGPYRDKQKAERQVAPVAGKFGLKPIVLGNR